MEAKCGDYVTSSEAAETVVANLFKQN